jgi:hypothetical protein
VLKASIFVFLIVVAANHVERDATDAAASDRNDLDDRFVDAKDEPRTQRTLPQQPQPGRRSGRKRDSSSNFIPRLRRLRA